MPIKVRNVVVNQVLKDDGSDVATFVSHLSDGQESAIADLSRAMEAIPSPPSITTIPYLDTEPRTIYGLKVLADLLVNKSMTPEEISR